MLTLILSAVLLQSKPQPMQLQTFVVKLTADQVERWRRKDSVAVTLRGRRADEATTGYRIFVNLPSDTLVPDKPKDLLPKNLPGDSVLSTSSKHLVAENYFLSTPPGKDMIFHLSLKTPRDRGLEIDPSQPLIFTVLAIPDKEGGSIPKVVIDEVSIEFIKIHQAQPFPEKKRNDDLKKPG